LGQDIMIGVAVPDLSEYTALDPCWGIGEPAMQFTAAVDGHRREGRLPVHGRDLGLVFASYRSNQPDEKVAAARRLAEDDSAFAVLGGRDFTEGALWLAAADVPVIDVNAIPSRLLARAAPWLFTLRAAQDVLYRSFAGWAHERGHLDGYAIGVFCDRLTRESSAAAVTELRRLGHEVRTIIDSEGVGAGSEQDESAPARFAADGIDVVLGFVGGTSWISTLRAAARLGYRPRLVDLETGEHTNDVTARFFPPDLYDGTPAMTMSRVGDIAAGRPLSTGTERAVAAYERSTGLTVARVAPVASGEWSNLLITSDLVTLLVEGLERAGPDPTRTALVRGLEDLRSVPMASGADVTFRPGEHWGFRAARAVRWHASRCAWTAVTDFDWVIDGDGGR
jgi:ABC-type branched-subunit amino acid transport system substrate-binding protein